MKAAGDFFNRAAEPLPNRPAPTPADMLKRLQCAAMWEGWRLLEVEPGGFAFVNMDNETDRYPTSGSIGPREVEQFLHARERERRLW